MAESRFDGKVVVITGAAGGIGKAAAQRFAREGARIVAVDLKDSALDDVSSTIDGEVLAVGADVSQSADVERYVAEAVARFGGIDAFFNNAGIEGVVAPLEEYPVEEFDRVLAVNVRGVFLGLKHVGPALRERGGGAIVNTASVAGLTGNPHVSAYIASKHAVIGLTRSAAIGFGPHGVRVNAVCPSPIETRMMRSLEKGFAPDDPESLKAQFSEQIPLGRYGEPAEVAGLTAFLCSDDARFITGSIYTIDGGMTPM